MKIAELRQKSKEDLKHLLQEKVTKKGELIFLLSQNKVKNVKEFGAVKKDIARILTLLK